MQGDGGIDLFLGGGGSESMSDSSGNSLFSGGGGADQFAGSDENDLFIGGAGNDLLDGDGGSLNGAAGKDVILFNRADGVDTAVRLGAATALSIGGLTGYTQIKLDRVGNQLSIKTGRNGVNFDDWYSGTASASRPQYLQIMTEGMRKYDPASADPTLNRKVVLYDLQGFIGAFDQAQAAGRRFVAADHLPQFFASGSDTQAYGGAVAYQYGTTGTFGALTNADLKAVTGAPGFGLQLQSIGVPIAAAAIAAFTAAQEAAESQVTTASSTSAARISLATTDTATIVAPDSGAAPAPSTSIASAPAETTPAARPAPRDPLADKLQSLIADWFAQAKDNGPSLSHYADIRQGVLRGASKQANDGALLNALQWSALGGNLARHLEHYDDAGLDFGGAWLRAAAGMSFGASDALGLPLPAGQELKQLKGLSEGLAKLG